MNRRRAVLSVLGSAAIVFALVSSGRLTAAGSVRAPEQVLGFKIGADNRLARWDRAPRRRRPTAPSTVC